MITLVAIVRDAAATLLRMLKSAEGICDRYVIVDTGSTDDTAKIAQKWHSTHPGVLRRKDWHGFAHNRTEALAIARGHGDYLLMLDADHILTLHGDLPELTADQYMLPITGYPIRYRLPLLVKNDRVWRYEGVAHSYLTCDGPATIENLDCLTVAGGGGVTREKLERDIQALSTEVAANPTDPRSVFYLARSHDDLDHVPEAIQFYRMRANMNGWEQERFYSRYRLGVLLCEHVNYWEGARELLAAAELLPARAAEPLRALANAGHAVADKLTLPEGLFVHEGAYRR